MAWTTSGKSRGEKAASGTNGRPRSRAAKRPRSRPRLTRVTAAPARFKPTAAARPAPQQQTTATLRPASVTRRRSRAETTPWASAVSARHPLWRLPRDAARRAGQGQGLLLVRRGDREAAERPAERRQPAGHGAVPERGEAVHLERQVEGGQGELAIGGVVQVGREGAADRAAGDAEDPLDRPQGGEAVVGRELGDGQLARLAEGDRRPQPRRQHPRPGPRRAGGVGGDVRPSEGAQPAERREAVLRSRRRRRQAVEARRHGRQPLPGLPEPGGGVGAGFVGRARPGEQPLPRRQPVEELGREVLGADLDQVEPPGRREQPPPALGRRAGEGAPLGRAAQAVDQLTREAVAQPVGVEVAREVRPHLQAARRPAQGLELPVGGGGQRGDQGGVRARRARHAR